MRAKEISERLAAVAPAVCSTLLPNGRKQGQEWLVGDTDGNPGKSLRVHLSGPKAGVWADFSSNQSGDLLDLWRECRGMSFVDALQDASQWLGVREYAPTSVGPARTWKRPTEPQAMQADIRVLEYSRSRGIKPETIEKFRVYSAAGKEGSRIAFPQYTPRGELSNIKFLAPRKSEGTKNDWIQSPGCERRLFGWQALDANSRWVVICEGEIDCMTLVQCGIPALSIPSGASDHGWIETEYEELDRFDFVVLCYDQDEPGRKASAEVANRLGLDFCKTVQLQGAKDPNELMLAKGPDGVRSAIHSAEYLDRSDLHDVASYWTAIEDEISKPKENQGAPMPFDGFGDFRFRSNELTVWTGINNHGKSLFLSQCVNHFVRRGERCVLYSFEMNPARMLQKSIHQILGTVQPTLAMAREAIMTFLAGSLYLYEPDPKDTESRTGRLISAFTYARKRYGVTHFLIDNFLGLGATEGDLDQQRQVMEKLIDFKNACGGHVHLVAHPRKKEDEKNPVGKMDIRGTGSLTDLADNVVSIWRDVRSDQDKYSSEAVDINQADGKVLVLKQRNGDDLKNVLIHYNRSSQQFTTERGVAFSLINGDVWEQHMDGERIVRGRTVDYVPPRSPPKLQVVNRINSEEYPL